MTADERRNDQRSRSSAALKQLRESYFGLSDKQKKKQLARDAYNQAKAGAAGEAPKAPPTSNVSASSLFELKGIVLEHRDKFAKEGRSAVKGEIRDHSRELVRDGPLAATFMAKARLVVPRQIQSSIAWHRPTYGARGQKRDERTSLQ